MRAQAGRKRLVADLKRSPEGGRRRAVGALTQPTVDPGLERIQLSACIHHHHVQTVGSAISSYR